MKQYQLLSPMSGYPAGTVFFGPYPIRGQEASGFYTKENIPTNPEGGQMCFFASAVENSPAFKLVTEPETKKTTP